VGVCNQRGWTYLTYSQFVPSGGWLMRPMMTALSSRLAALESGQAMPNQRTTVLQVISETARAMNKAVCVQQPRQLTAPTSLLPYSNLLTSWSRNRLRGSESRANGESMESLAKNLLKANYANACIGNQRWCLNANWERRSAWCKNSRQRSKHDSGKEAMHGKRNTEVDPECEREGMPQLNILYYHTLSPYSRVHVSDTCNLWACQIVGMRVRVDWPWCASNQCFPSKLSRYHAHDGLVTVNWIKWR